MSINLSMPEPTSMQPRILVIGVGGAGGNAVNNMIAHDLRGVDFVTANTDSQALNQSLAPTKIQLGQTLTSGLGAGSKPEIGRAAAEEAVDTVRECLDGSHMVFITAGMGGGTGTGAAPVIARIAREYGVLTVAVITKPFQFEGNRRMAIAETGIEELSEQVDTLITIPNQNLFRVANEKTTFADAFAMADEVLHSGVRGVTDLMVHPGVINLDFADVQTVMEDMGLAVMGTGEESGEERAKLAAQGAISNPLLDDVSITGARGVLISISGSRDSITLYEVEEAAELVRKEVDADANVIVGTSFNDDLGDRIRVSVFATGLGALTARRSGAHEDEARVLKRRVHLATSAGAKLPAPAPEPEPEPVPEIDTEELTAMAEMAELVTSPAAAAGDAASAPFIPPRPMMAPMAPEPVAAAPAKAAQPERKLSIFQRVTGRGGKNKIAAAEQAPAPAAASELVTSARAEAETATPPPGAALGGVHAGDRPVPTSRDDEPEPMTEPEKVDISQYMREAEEKVHETLNPLPEPATDEDQLEIPAFLRRQAN